MHLQPPDEEELLWNELDHHGSNHASAASHRDAHGHGQPYSTAPPPSPSVSLPPLRAHVHLPAISTLFQDVVQSSRGTIAKLRGQSNGSARVVRRRPRAAPDEHGVVANIDAFLISLYNYFYHKGFWSILVVELVGLFTTLFSVVLSTFLLDCVDWSALVDCRKNGNVGCPKDLEHYITCRADTNDLTHLVVVFYFMIFVVYWISRLMQVGRTLMDAYEMASFYSERLHIDERQVQTIKWDEVVNRVLDLVGVNVPKNVNQLSSYRLQIDPASLATPHDFARRIMRRENYLIACMSHSIFQERKLLPSFLQFASTSEVMFSRNMEANLNICLLDHMFDANHNLSTKFVQDVKMLQKRFVIAGVLNLVLIPFLLLYRVFRFLFLSAQEWHMNRVHYFGTRRWSSYALWRFREYNELPHVLDARMERSYPLAEKYLALFPAGAVGIVAGGVAFCASSMMAVLVAVSLVEESILLETTFRDRQLLWYLTIFTGIFALARSFASSSSPFLTNGDCEEAMAQLAAETHHFPKDWRGRCHLYEVRDAFLNLFPYKAVLFAQECLSVVMAPYILCFSLPPRSREILLFLRSHTLALPNAGSVCRFAEFDFKQYGSDPKMESSFVNFKQNHPKWVGEDEGERLMQRIERFRVEEMEKSMQMSDTMFGASKMGGFQQHPLSLSHQLMQSQAIYTALGGQGPGALLGAPQDNEFYWLDKLHQQQNGRMDLEFEDPRRQSISSSIDGH